jgi:hypothetical protein
MLSNCSFFFHQVEWEAGSPRIEHVRESQNRMCKVILAPLLHLAEVLELAAEVLELAAEVLELAAEVLELAVEGGRNACPSGRKWQECVPGCHT